MIDLPTPSGYRAAVPAFASTEPAAPARRAERKRRLAWFAIAVALHVALLLGLWLTPPLRLKAGYAPERWVQVVALPKKSAQTPVLAVPRAVEPSRPKAKDRKLKDRAVGRTAQPATAD